MSSTDEMVYGGCNHKFLFDPESNEDVCASCGFVEIPSYKRAQEAVEKQSENRLEDFIPFMPGLPVIENQNREIPHAMSATVLLQQMIDPNMEPLNGKKEYIVSKTTELDFSCGGFLSTKIDTRNVDFVGKHCNSAHYNKIRYINNYIMSSTGLATYKNAIWMIASFSDKLHLPFHVKERAAEIFRKIYYSTTNIHNSKNSVCACIYYACKESQINRNMNDISKVAEEDVKYNSEIFTTFQKIINLLKLEVPKNFTIQDEIAFLGSKLGLAEKNVRLAIDIYTEVKGRKRIYFTGKAPRIIATTLLYIAAMVNNFAIDEKLFCERTNVTEYILRNRVRENLRSKYFRKYRRSIPIEKRRAI